MPKRKRSLPVDTLASEQEAKRVLGNAVVSQVVFQPKWRESQGGQVTWTKQLPPAWLDGWQSDFWPRKKSIPSALAWVQVALWKLGRMRDNLRDLQALGVRTPLETDYALIRQALVEDAALLKRILGLRLELSPESASPEAYLDALHNALLDSEEQQSKQQADSFEQSLRERLTPDQLRVISEKLRPPEKLDMQFFSVLFCPELSSQEKLFMLARIEQPLVYWNSAELAALLGVSSSAIRQLKIWRVFKAIQAGKLEPANIHEADPSQL